MVMKPGYKQTEVGVIPEDWAVSPLGKLADSSSGTTPSRTLQDRYYTNGSIPWVKTLDLANADLLGTSERVTELALKETCLRIYPAGTVLVAMYGGFQQIGRTGLLRIPAAVNQAITAIQPKNDALVSEYLLGTLNYRVDYWKRVASSSRKDPNITGRDIRNFPIAYPSPPEQRAIAGALGDVDALLGALEQLLAKKRDLKQAAMQQLLTGQTRLPGFTGKWEVKRLVELGKISGAGVDKKIRPGEPQVRLVNYMDVYRRNFIYSKDLNHVVSARPDQAARCAVEQGDVFFTPSSEMPFDIAVSAIAMEDIPDAAYSYHVVRLRLNEDWDLLFRAYAFKSQEFLNQAARACEGSGVRYVITQGKFRQLSVRFPPQKAEQAAIGAVLSDMDAELAALEARLAKTRALKQGIMQELLTGKTRLI